MDSTHLYTHKERMSTRPHWLREDRLNHRGQPFSSGALERWQNFPSDELGTWVDLDLETKLEWLYLVRLHWFALCGGGREVPPEGTTYTMDGGCITDRPSLHLALGEAINGPRGYFGGCLDALADCLCGGFGAPERFTLVWQNSEVARTAFPATWEEARSGPSDGARLAPFDEYVAVFGDRVVLR